MGHQYAATFDANVDSQTLTLEVIFGRLFATQKWSLISESIGHKMVAYLWLTR